MSDRCTPNSTDCLLRALVDLNSGYNWNPLNFAFTAALSVLGFIVATVTLIQGLLAAGPGRLKASRSALGPAYSQKAHTRFDRTELRFRTLVRVPVLDVYKLMGTEEASAPPRRRRIRISGDHTAAGSSQDSSRSLASWSRLLEELDLEDFAFETLPCATDYLPADIQAAPAYATVESLVIMALLAGCDNIQPAEGFLRATGSNVQLDFRPHANLGMVAAYQHYFSTVEIEVDSSSHVGTIHEALGHLRYSGSTLFELNVSFVQRAGNVMDYDVLAEAIDRQRSECDHPGCASRKSTVASWKSFLTDEKPNQDEIDKLATLLFADKPTTARMFPTAAADFRRLVNDLGNRKYKDTWFHESSVAQDLAVLPESEALIDIVDLEQFDPSRAGEPQDRDDSSWFVNTRYLSTNVEGLPMANLLPSESHRRMSPLRSIALDAFVSDLIDTKVLEEDSILISKQALTTCFSWLANSELFTTMESGKRASARAYLMLQLREVDIWLRRYGGSDALCGALNMITRLQTLAPLEDGAENRRQTDADSTHGEDEPKPKPRTSSPATESRVVDPTDSGRPTWIRCNRKWLAPETVNHYHLPWEFDPRDPAYLIIKKWIPEDFQVELFEHTRKLRAQEAEQYMTTQRYGKKNQLYFVRRRRESRKRGASTSPGHPGEQRPPAGRRRSTQASRVHRAGSQGNEDTQERQHERGADVQIHQDERNVRPEGSLLQQESDNRTETDVANTHLPRFTIESAADEGQEFGDKQLASSTAMGESHEDPDRLSHSSAKNQRQDSAQKQGNDPAEGGKRDSPGADDGTKKDAIVTGDDLSASTPSGHSSRHSNETGAPDGSKAPQYEPTLRMKAMETMLLYRAMLFACVLATGSDTSDLLWLENRNRVVQVL